METTCLLNDQCLPDDAFKPAWINSIIIAVAMVAVMLGGLIAGS